MIELPPAEYTDFDPTNFVFETPLYERQKYSWSSREKFVGLFEKEECKLDGYCIECGRNSVFHSIAYNPQNYVSMDDLLGIRIARLKCQRNNNHLIYIVMRSSQSKDGKFFTTEKIGQTPSHADIANGGISEFGSVLVKDDRAEFIRANGLAAHGVHIGAFVYLRRVFERLILRAKQREPQDLSEKDFNKLRITEKIDALSGSLPSFMVENKKVYSVLSKGVHELNENECGQYYELLRASIIMMLEQEREIKERHDREASLSKLLNQIDLKNT